MRPDQPQRQASNRVGLALGGGAVRGAAHVGVLQVLEREGIRPSVIAGTSVGAIVGACYAAGVTPDTLSRLFGRVRWSQLARLAWPRALGLFDAAPLEALVQTIIGVHTFDELPRQFAAVACDITTGQRIVLDQGPIARAVRASTAIPGIFVPVEIDGQLLVDGGVVDNLPVDVVRAMGADYVIAVDLFPPPCGQPRPETLFEVLLIAASLWSRGNHPPPATIDCLILPDIGEYRIWDFEAVPELEARGRAAAEHVVAQLRADLGLDHLPTTCGRAVSR